MNSLRLAVVVAMAACGLMAQSSWTLVRSRLSYQVVHPLHQVEGVSDAARGRGVCQASSCEFLIAAPVKSFQSGDSNRDLHMLQVTRGGEFPMITVRTTVPEAAIKPGELSADVKVQFAGQTMTFRNVEFQLSAAEGGIELRGTIPATLQDFKITPPELLMMPIHDQIPVAVDTVWQKQ